MDDSELERTPNPFSAFAQTRAQSRRHLAASAKLLLFAIGLFCVLTVGQVYLHRAKLSGIVERFSQGSPAEKLQHLEQLHASDVDGIVGLVAALSDEKPEVSEMAADMLADFNRKWTTLPAEMAAERRSVFADSLATVASKLDDKSDARWIRVQTLAHRAAQDLIDASCGDDDPTYRALMTVIAADGARPIDAVPDRDAGDRPLPIDLVDQAGSSWTQWPPTQWPPTSNTPTSNTPTLVRRQVATLGTMDDEQQVVLNQIDTAESEMENAATLLRPRIRPAATLADQSRQAAEVVSHSTSYWMTQLASGSRWVRMQAVAELVKRGDDQAISALRVHLESERDAEIVSRIHQQLSP